MSANVLHTLYDAREGAAPALCPPGASAWTTDALRAAVAGLTSALAAEGVGRGDHVSLMLAKSPRAVAAAHACLALGAVLHPIDMSATDDEVAYLLTDARARLIVCAPEDGARLAAFSAVPVATLDAAGSGTLGARAAEGTPAPGFAAVGGDDPAALLYTSGTTGKPKGALITHRNLAESARALVAVWRLRDDDVLLHALPLHHAHGLFTALNTVLAAGGSALFLPRFEVDAVLAAAAQATVIMGVPTHYARLLRAPGFTPSQLRLAVSGSAPLPQGVADAFARATGVAIRERYGLTEAAIIAAVPACAEARPGWVGWPLPGIEVRVRDADGATRDRAALGTLETRGHNVFAGYLYRPEADRAAFTEDGWFATGDIAEIDATGCLRIKDRAKDLIITGGENVFPGEVEAALAEIDGIVAAAVVGVPHPDFGEAVVAAVETEAAIDEAAVIRAVRARLSGAKTPKRVVAVDEIPRNRLGKILKHTLRERFQTMFEKTRGSGDGTES